MTHIDVTALRAAAEGATPGEWVTEHDEYGDEWWFGGTNDGGQVTVGKLGGTHHIVTDAGHAADMAHIAAANPAVVLALLDALEDEQWLRRTLEAQVAAGDDNRTIRVGALRALLRTTQPIGLATTEEQP